MEYVYAALLLDEAGKEINENNIKEVVKAAGLDPDEAKAKAIVVSLKEVNIKDVIQNAQNMQMSAASAPQVEQKAEPEEAKEEDAGKKEEEAAGGLAGLFG